jgi:hypothetical protein
MNRLALWTLSAVAVVLLSVPAFACINDSEVKNYEREFKSNYNQAVPAQPAPSSPPGNDLLVGLGLGMGGTFLLSACVLGVVLARGPQGKS